MDSAANVNGTMVSGLVKALSPVRYLFYAVGPKEMAQAETLDQVPDYIVEAIPYFLLMIVVELAVSIAKGKSAYTMNDTMVSLMQGSTQMLWGFWIRFLQMGVYCWMYDRFHLFDFGAHSNWSSWIACMIMTEFGYYWMHRTAHEYHVLWSAHSVHHSGEYYNFATALRQGALQPWFSWMFMMHNAVVGIHPLVFAHHKSLNTLYQFYIHTCIIGHMGPLEYIFNTPSHHRMHHRPPGNCNYGGVLIIFDRMFGTFVGELEQKDYYGLAKQYDTLDPVYANAEHLRRMAHNVNPEESRTLMYYIRLLFKRRVHHKLVFKPLEVFRPLPTPKRSLWDTPAPNKRVPNDGGASSKHPLMRAYITFLFVTAMIGTVSGLQFAGTFTNEDAVVVQFVCFILFISIGRLMDGLEKGLRVNFFRILCFLAMAISITNDSDSTKTTPKSVATQMFQYFSVLDAAAFTVIVIMQSLFTQSVPAAKKSQ